MATVKYVSWEEDGAWQGYLQDFPDSWTQGETLDDLKDHLRDLSADLSGGQLPGVRRVDDLDVAVSAWTRSGQSKDRLRVRAAPGQG